MADYLYIRLDGNGLLFLLQQLKLKMDESSVAIDTAINAESTNAHAAGSKAVYDFVTAAIADVSTFHAEIVEELPSAGASNILYLVAKASGESGNVYDEYLYIGGAWELIGSTDIDLSGYVKASEMHALTNSEITAIIEQVWEGTSV